MDISEVVMRSGVAASTLRFYEERGLIASIGRHGLKRVFAPSVLDRLALIALGREAGLSLDEIAPMLGGSGRAQIDRNLLNAKADAIDRSIHRQIAMRDGLRHAAACSAPHHMDCPKFRRLLGLATQRKFITTSGMKMATGRKDAAKRAATAKAVAPKVTGPASYFPSIEKKYGHPVDHWFKLLGKKEELKHMEMVSWLKSDFDMGHGHASALVAHFRTKEKL
jgi:DNA-binding transcriptional MerR regulator